MHNSAACANQRPPSPGKSPSGRVTAANISSLCGSEHGTTGTVKICSVAWDFERRSRLPRGRRTSTSSASVGAVSSACAGAEVSAGGGTVLLGLHRVHLVRAQDLFAAPLDPHRPSPPCVSGSRKNDRVVPSATNTSPVSKGGSTRGSCHPNRQARLRRPPSSPRSGLNGPALSLLVLSRPMAPFQFSGVNASTFSAATAAGLGR